MSLAQEAKDALVRVDGVDVYRSTNSFDDLIEGVKIDLKGAEPGTIVSLGVTRPTAAIEQGVGDFVAAYNELMKMIAEATAYAEKGDGGALRGDLGVREMKSQLGKLPTMILSSTGEGPHTLAEIGVRTNRDGTLSVNAAQLKERLAEDPEGVEALFNPTQFSSSPFVTIKSAIGRVRPGVYTVTDLVAGPPASGKIGTLAMTPTGSNLIAPSASKAVGLILGIAAGAPASATITIDPGLGGALDMIRDDLRARTGPFATTQERLASEAKAIAEERDLLESRSSKYYNQLLSTFTSMERQVSAFKATQSYLDQQVKMWTNDSN
jgi:flagellar hook-associated protein 2